MCVRPNLSPELAILDIVIRVKPSCLSQPPPPPVCALTTTVDCCSGGRRRPQRDDEGQISGPSRGKWIMIICTWSRNPPPQFHGVGVGEVWSTEYGMECPHDADRTNADEGHEGKHCASSHERTLLFLYYRAPSAVVLLVLSRMKL